MKLLKGKVISVVILSILSIFFYISIVYAKVTGVCSNCHTMHFSQTPWPTNWGGSGPNTDLLVKDCVGCHTNTQNGDTIVTIGPAGGESRIPIVYNSAVEPTQPLAGGNFYWVVKNGDAYGHNVLSIPEISADANLTSAPGAPVSGGQCAVCHDQTTHCYSCHTPQHHKDDHPGGVFTNVVGYGTTAGCYYRFLGPASERIGLPDVPNIPWHTNPGVKGIEDPDWEQNPSSTQHNEYAGETSRPSSFGGGYESISDFCAGCHAGFYNSPFYTYWSDGSTSSPWHRHPVDIKFSEVKGTEYIYNTPDGTTFGPYNPLAPIARANIDALDGSGPSSTVTTDDQVMCLSCHRPHGSPYPDILRWDYTACEAGTANTNCGCFVCHTKKDE